MKVNIYLFAVILLLSSCYSSSSESLHTIANECDVKYEDSIYVLNRKIERLQDEMSLHKKLDSIFFKH